MVGCWFVVVEKGWWFEGWYLVVDVQIVVEWVDLKKGGEVDWVFICLEVVFLVFDVDGYVWWFEVFDELIKYIVGVSQDLCEGVCEFIEIIVNEVVLWCCDCGLELLSQDQVQLLVMQLLWFFYWIFFLLYVEVFFEFGVLLVGVLQYDFGYLFDRLCEFVQVFFVIQWLMVGIYLYESLGMFFWFVDWGNLEDVDDVMIGLSFYSLCVDLFCF